MQLKELAAKPKLKKIVVETPFVMEAYGEPLEFYMWDRQDVATFLRILQLKQDQKEIFNLVRDTVLDEEGNKILQEGEMLPLEIMLAVVEAVVNNLGNFKPLTTQSSAQNLQHG